MTDPIPFFERVEKKKSMKIETRVNPVLLQSYLNRCEMEQIVTGIFGDQQFAFPRRQRSETFGHHSLAANGIEWQISGCLLKSDSNFRFDLYIECTLTFAIAAFVQMENKSII